MHASLDDLAKYFIWHLRGHRCLDTTPSLSQESFFRLHQVVDDAGPVQSHAAMGCESWLTAATPVENPFTAAVS